MKLNALLLGILQMTGILLRKYDNENTLVIIANPDLEKKDPVCSDSELLQMLKREAFAMQAAGTLVADDGFIYACLKDGSDFYVGGPIASNDRGSYDVHQYVRSHHVISLDLDIPRTSI